MPRIRVRKTCRGIYPPDAFPQAYEAVLHGQTIRGAARLHGVSESTLRRYMKKKRQDPDAPLPGYRAHNRVLSREEEAFLRDDLLKARDIIGLSSREVRRLAFQLAREHGCKYPEVWATRGMAGKDWLTSFLERNGALSPTDPRCGNLQEEAEQQESSPSLDQVKLEPPQIKEEQEEVLIRSKEAGGSTLTLLAVKSDDDNDEKPEPPVKTSTEHMQTQAYVEYCTPSQPTSDDQLLSSESDTEDSHSSESDTEDSHSSESDTEDGEDWAPNLSEYKTKDIDDGEWETRDDELNDEFLQAITSSLDSEREKNDPIANYCTALADRMRELSPLDLCVLRSMIDGKVNLLLLAAARRDARRENTARTHAKSQYTAHEQSTQTCD